MTAQINIQADQGDINRIIADLRHIDKGMQTVLVRSMNRTVDGVKTDMVKVAKGYTVKPTAVRKNIKVIKASVGNLTALTFSKGKPIGLIDFKVSPSTVNPKRKSPISVEVIKGQKKTLKHGFVSVMKPSHKGVFKRKSSARLPIKKLYGPRIEDLYAKPENQKLLQDGADKRLKAELDRQSAYLFKQRNGLL